MKIDQLKFTYADGQIVMYKTPFESIDTADVALCLTTYNNTIESSPCIPDVPPIPPIPPLPPEPVKKYFTFSISPTPADAIVVLNGEATTSIKVEENTEVTWEVSAEGYISQSGTEVVTSNKSIEVTLEEEQNQGVSMWSGNMEADGVSYRESKPTLTGNGVPGIYANDGESSATNTDQYAWRGFYLDFESPAKTISVTLSCNCPAKGITVFFKDADDNIITQSISPDTQGATKSITFENTDLTQKVSIIQVWIAPLGNTTIQSYVYGVTDIRIAEPAYFVQSADYIADGITNLTGNKGLPFTLETGFSKAYENGYNQKYLTYINGMYASSSNSQQEYALVSFNLPAGTTVKSLGLCVGTSNVKSSNYAYIAAYSPTQAGVVFSHTYYGKMGANIALETVEVNMELNKISIYIYAKGLSVDTWVGALRIE